MLGDTGLEWLTTSHWLFPQTPGPWSHLNSLVISIVIISVKYFQDYLFLHFLPDPNTVFGSGRAAHV